MQCTVFVPLSAASLLGVLEREGPLGGKLDVQVGGETYQEALERAERFKADLGPSGYVSVSLSLCLCAVCCVGLL